MAESSALTKSLEETRSALEEETKKREEFEALNLALTETLEKVQAYLNSTTAPAETAGSEDDAALADTLTVVEDTLKQSEDVYTDFVDQIATLSASLSEAQEKLQAETEAREKADSEKASLAESLQTAESSLEEITKVRETIESENAALTETLNATKASLEDVTAARDTAQTENAALVKSLEEAQTALAEITKAQEAALAENTALQESLKATEASLTEQLETIRKELAEEKEALAAEKEARTQAEQRAAQLEQELAEEKASGETLAQELEAAKAETETVSAALTEEEEKTADLETQVTALEAENESLRFEADDLRGVAVLEAQLPLETPDPNYSKSEDATLSQITWARFRMNEKGYPQLWLSVMNEDGLMALLFYRDFADEENNPQEELYDRYTLDGDTLVVRYRTLSKPGSYTVVALDSNGEYRNFGVLAKVEDVDGNGIIDTLTDAEQNITLLEIENAFSVVKESGD